MHTVIHSHMVHARFLEAYVHFEIMDKTYHIFPVLPIKYLMNEDGDPKMPHKITTGKKPSVSHYACFFPCVVRPPPRPSQNP